MPVHLDSHDPEIDLTPGTTKSDIVAFLYSNPEYGYRPNEIATELDIPHGTTTTTLTRLHEEGYIGKTEDSYHYALDNREDLRRYVASLDQLDRMFTQPSETAVAESHQSEHSTHEDVAEAELEAELDDLERELDE